MLNNIELQNWKSHGNSVLEFAKGTNIIIGQMGAGKSSVLDAISFGLFGTFPSIQHRKVGVSNLIQNRPSEKESATVKLSFSVGNDHYVVTRQISTSGSAKATLEKNGEYVQSQPQRVNEEIVRALKVDYDLFSKAIYSEQNDLDYFLKLRASERKKQMDELLGLDKFSNAQENAGSVINKLKDMVSESERIVSTLDIESLKQQLEKLTAELVRLSSDKKRLESELESKSAIISAMDSNLKSMKVLYQQKINLEKEIASKKNRLLVLNAEIGKIDALKYPALHDLETKKVSVNGQQKKATEDSKNARDQETKLQGIIERTKSQISENRKKKEISDKVLEDLSKIDRKKLDEEITALKSSIDENGRKIAEYAFKKSESKRWISELENHVQTCPICERELGEEMQKKLLADKRRNIEDMDSEIGKASLLDTEYREKLKRAEAENTRAIRLEAQIHDYVDPAPEISKLSGTLASAEKEILLQKGLYDSSTKTLNELNSAETELRLKIDALKRREEYAKQVLALSTEIGNDELSLSKLDINTEKLDALQAEFTEAMAQNGRILSDVAANRKYLSDAESQISDKKTEISKIEKLYTDIKTKRDISENLVKFRTSLQETQTVLRTKLIDSINTIMHEVWPDIYPYGDYTSVMLEADADDYVLKLRTGSVDNGKWENVESIASGGERSVACLAMRIAFSLVLAPNLGLLILDEPTHNIDQQGLEKFVKTFNEVLPKIVEQTLIITHDPILKKAYNSKVYLLSRNKDEHGVAEVGVL